MPVRRSLTRWIAAPVSAQDTPWRAATSLQRIRLNRTFSPLAVSTVRSTHRPTTGPHGARMPTTLQLNHRSSRHRIVALLFAGMLASGCQELSPAETLGTSQQALDDERCTWGLGYWKNHPAAWRTTTLALGTLAYSQEQLLAILHEPVEGNGLVSLAHQLIAAKLNRLEGAEDVTDGALAYADALIGGNVVPPIGSGSLLPEDTSTTTTVLDAFNKGRLEGACHIVVCGDGIVDPPEQCDDGNLDPFDGCFNDCLLDNDPGTD
jgi:cysteine-rich repeat protein